jgi:CRISPR-associated protein Csm1
MEKHPLLDASCRVALAALLHDLGKFAERAQPEELQARADAHKASYCPLWKGRYSHVHAAYTALAFDVIEKHLPDVVRGDVYPFASWVNRDTQAADDSLVNAAARHHQPETFLQWVVATADRLASGFERNNFADYNAAEEESRSGANYRQARLWPLLESIRLDGKADASRLPRHRQPLQALSAEALFPVEAGKCERTGRDGDEAARDEYRKLWQGFTESLVNGEGRDRIPKSHQSNLALWLDHFDSLWLTFTHAIPSATAGKKDGHFIEIPADVSLYDHSKTTAALAVALWRWHEEQENSGADGLAGLKLMWDKERQAESAGAWAEPRFLLVQGDFSGIQNFLFAGGNHTNKHAAKLLRGRSFYVSLLTELAALKVLDALGLPPTSQIINAAGKFLIVAPNTAAARAALAGAEEEINGWFLQHSFGEAGIGLVSLPACCNDFVKAPRSDGQRAFGGLMQALFAQLEEKKLQRYALCRPGAQPAVFAGALARYHNGTCELNSKLPADKNQRSTLSADQVKTGESLTKKARLLITRTKLDGSGALRLPIFGYCVQFTAEEEASGKFGQVAREGQLLRAWDFSMTQKGAGAQPLFHGYARRAINSHAPEFDADKLEWESGKYGKWEGEIDFDPQYNRLKTLNHIACENRHPRDATLDKWQGQSALMTLKGDIDNLGTLFQRGLADPTFAKMAALSRQVNAFFTVWLPWYCVEHYPNTYTVFAGGDDFFLIGPWHDTLKLARDMRREFSRYVANNADISFSAGLVMTKPGLPVRYLAETAEAALEAAKQHKDKGAGTEKNAVCAFGHTVSWDDFGALLAGGETLDRLLADHKLSMGYRYGLLNLTDKAASNKPEDAIWRAHLAYRTRRYVVDKLKKDDAEARRVQAELVTEIGEKGIMKFGGAYKIALFTHLYQYRD